MGKTGPIFFEEKWTRVEDRAPDVTLSLSLSLSRGDAARPRVRQASAELVEREPAVAVEVQRRREARVKVERDGLPGEGAHAEPAQSRRDLTVTTGNSSHLESVSRVSSLVCIRGILTRIHKERRDSDGALFKRRSQRRLFFHKGKGKQRRSQIYV